jgi:adenine-specific DNA-methyltransferase
MPPRNKKAKTPTQVDAITHRDKRANLPTADQAADWHADEVAPPMEVRYPRDPTLDPQLVWKGKDELDGEDLVADAAPIYIQEKVNPRVLIENLRNTAGRPEDEPEMTLFDSFDGLDELDIVEFYKHPANWSNRMILGDSLNVMASLTEREALRGKVQMIYIDPPYGIDFSSNWQATVRNRDVRDGQLKDASREVEQIKAFRDTWALGIHSYLAYLRDRLQVAKDLLTRSGSVFVQISDDNVHLVRNLMDEVFGNENAHPPIIFRKKMMPMMKEPGFESTFDYILWYQRDRSSGGLNALFGAKTFEGDSGWRWVELPDGSRRKLTAPEIAHHSLLPEGSRVFQPISMLPRQYRANQDFDFDFEGKSYPPPKNICWSTTREGMERLAHARRLHPSGKEGLRYVYFADDYPVGRLTAAWMDAAPATNQTYVVETNTRIVSRCMLATTLPGDLVVDPTCGSGTTAYVAEQYGRRWITIDTSRVALALARQRLMGARFPYYLLSDSTEGRAKESELSAQPLPPAAPTNDVRHGFVYERASHVTLGSITNNPDIHDGMPRAETDAAIRRHAEFELLYDKPYEDAKRVRVSGPFTVESLSPHRSLAFAGSAVDDTGAVNTDTVEDASSGEAAFEQTILANLRTAGIQNGRKGERLAFDSLEGYASPYIQAVGEREEAVAGTPRRVGITIGPQYGTVGPSFVKEAALEANRAGDIDLLCVLAFSFDPTVVGATDDYVAADEGFANVAAERQLGKVPVLLVRMNADLVMGEELKKTGAANLFTVFGEPDIEIVEDRHGLCVRLHGVDVYDPNTGEMRSNETDQIALWMIDSAYNGESFFVRHCYFTGGQEPYAQLKRALKADIDEDAWSSLYGTESRAFARPETSKIAVKVINDYGDEVMKVFDV